MRWSSVLCKRIQMQYVHTGYPKVPLSFIDGLYEIIWKIPFSTKMWSITTTILLNAQLFTLITATNATLSSIFWHYLKKKIRYEKYCEKYRANKFWIIFVEWFRVKWSSYLYSWIFSVYFIKCHHNMQKKKIYLFDIEDEEKTAEIRRKVFMTT